MQIKTKIKVLMPVVIITLFSVAFLSAHFSLAQTTRQLDVSGYILNNENKEILNGEYKVRFVIYSGEQNVWQEIQTVAVNNGIFNAYLGSVNPLPSSLNFSGEEYSLGIKIGDDSEMEPRRKIGAVPAAINSRYLEGEKIGTGKGDILQLGNNGKVDIKRLPTGTSGNKLLKANDDRLHDQNTDTGTDSLEFNIGSAAALSGNNFNISVSEQTIKPTLRFNGTTNAWQFSNDGSTFSDIGSGSAMGNYLLLAGGTMTGDISFASTQTFGGATLTELGYMDGVTGSIQTQLDSKAAVTHTHTKSEIGLGNVENTALSAWAGTTNITTLGTISTGAWNGAAIAAAYGGTGLTSYTAGDMLYYSSGNTLTALGIGSDGQVLRSLSGVPVWGAPVVGAAHNLLSLTHTDTTADNVLQGDLITGQDSGGGTMRWQRMAVGNAGQFLGTDGTDITWNDTTSITQLGTITAGVWNGTAVDDFYIANDLTLAGATIGTSTIDLKADSNDNTEGVIEWDETNNRILVGTGASQVEFYSGAGAGGLDGSGTANYVTYWSDSDTLTSAQYMSVSQGGTGIGTFTSNGILYGNTTSAIQATAAGTSGQLLVANGAGTPVFVSMSGDVNITNAGVTAIQADSVALTTDTTGNYVASVTNGSGISGGDGGSEAAGLTLSLGNLTSDWNQTGAFDIVLGNASSGLKIMESTGATYYGILDVADLTASDKTYTFPNATGTVALTSDLHNEVTLAGTPDYITIANQVITRGQIDLTTDVTGALPVANGGTGATTFTSNGVLYGNTAGAIGATAAGTDGQLLIAATSSAPAFTAMSGDVNITAAGVTTIQADAIGSSEIMDDTIAEADLDVTNAPTSGYILKYDSGGGFTWAEESGGTGASKWTDAGTFTYLTETSDDLAIGGSTAATAGFFFDVSTGSIQIEGTANDYETTLAVVDPTADRTITFQDADGTVAYQSELHDALTLSGAYDYITLSGQDIVRGQIDLTTDVINTLSVSQGGTGAVSFTSNGILYGNTASAIQATAAGTSGQLLVANGAGTPVFVSMSGDVNITNAGVTAIQADSVALTTDTTGNYVASVTNGSGISGGDGGSEAAGLTLSLGNLTSDWNQTGAFDIVLGNASSGLKIMESTGATYYGILDVADLTASDKTYTFPNATGTVALTSDLHNEVTLAGTPDYITIANQVITRGQIDLTTDVTGALPVANGGTGATTFTSNGVLYGNTAGAIGATAAGTDGQLLIAATSSAPAFTAMSGDVNITAAGVTTIQADAIGSSEIMGSSIEESDLDISNEAVDGYILSYNDTESKFTWITNSGGSGASKWSDAGTYTYLTNTTDDLVLGSTATDTAPFFFDVSENTITIEGTTSNDYETTLVFTDPTDDRTITFPDASGTVVFSGGAGSSKWTDSGTLTYLSETTDDLTVGGSTLAAAFSVDVSANTARVGSGATANAVLNMYASDGDTGSLTYTTSDAWAFENGNVGIGNTTPAALLTVGSSGAFQVNSFGAIAAATGITSSGTITFSDFGAGIIHSDAAGILSSSAVDITSADITGTLAVGSGGTGATTFTSNGVLYGNTAGAIGATAAGTDGQLLIAATSSAPAFTAMSGDVNITAAGVTTIQADAIGSSEIMDDTIAEADLDVTNAPTSGYILKYDSGGGFTWAEESGGTGASKWTDAGTFTYLTETSDDLAIGGSTAATAGFFFDVSTGSIQIEGTANDYETTLAVVDPTADRTITFQDADGTVAYQSELHDALTLSGAYDYITLSGQDIVRGQIDLTTDVINTLSVSQGGTGAVSFTSNGILYGNTASAIQATAAGTSGQLLVANGAGTPVFVSMSGDVNITNAGVTAIQADSVALTTDTTGNYVASVTNGSGISGGDGGSEAAGLTLSLGNLTSDWNQTGAFDIVLGNASSGLKIMESTGATYYGILDVADLTASDKTYTFPNATGTVALTSDLHNEVTLAGTPDYITIANQVITRGQIDLTTDVTGALPVANGGTGATTFTSNGVLYGNTAGAIGATAAGTDGQLLIAATSSAPAFTAMSGDVNITAAGVTTIQADAIGSSEIMDDTIAEADLDVTNAPTSGYILKYDSGGGFTWAEESGGTGASKWTDAGTFTYLTETSDDLAIGGSTAATAGFFFDVSTGSIQIEGTANDYETTLAVVDPTADRTITFQDADGTVAYQSELHDALTLSGAYDYITLSGQDIVRGRIDLTTDVAGLLPADNGGTGITTASSTGVPYISAGTWSVDANYLAVAHGGTGLDGSAAANGTLLIGNGTGYTLATLTDGTGITITEGAGTITIASILGTSIETGEITDDTILEADLRATNTATDGQVLTFDNASGGFTWSSAGSGGIGDITAVGNATTGDAFTANGTGNSLYFEGATANDIETILTAADPTVSDKTITLPNTSGTVITSGNLTDITAVGTVASGTWNGTIIDVAHGGTNSGVALNNSMVMISSGDAIIESTDITITELGLLNGITGALYSAGGTDVAVADGGTGASTLDNLITLTTHTAGDYVASVTNGSGISGGDGGSEGATLTLALGALTADWNQTGAYDIALANASSELKIMGSGGTYYGILEAGNITTADKTYTFPDLSGAVALTANNLSVFAATTSAQLSGVLSDENTSGGYMTDPMTTVGDIIYGSASGAPARLAGGTTGQILQSNTTAAPSWSTATYPSTATSAGTVLRSNGTNWIVSGSTFADTYTASNLLYSNGANAVTGLATANNGILTTSATGVPSIATDIPAAVTIGSAYIYRAGGTDVAVADGGTGASTLDNLITLGDHTTGNYVATITAGDHLTSTGAISGEGIVHSLSVDDDFIKLVGDTTGAMSEDLNLDNSTLVLSYDDNKVGIGTADPYSDLEIYSSTANPFLTITGAHDTDYDPMIKFRTDATPTVKFSMGVDAGDSDKFKIYSGDGIGGTSEFTIDTDGTTSISNLELGAQSFETNAGAVTWIDMPVTSAAAAGTVESYTAMIDGNGLLTVYAESDGANGIQDSGVGIGTTTPTAYLHIKAGTATAGTAPLKFTSGTNLTAPEAGAMEFNGTDLFYTTSVPTRRTIVNTAASQTLTNKTLSAGSTWNGTAIAANYGGTGMTSYTIGDIIYASGATALSALADVTVGNVLISGGAGAAPSWGKVDLTAHISGILPVANGGTGATTLTGMLKGSGAGAFTAVTGTADYVAYWSDTNTIAAEQYLDVTRGGTGAGTFTSNYLLKGNGTGALAASIIYDNGTNVGIGVNDPDELLEIYGGNLKLSYDGSNYATLNAESDGALKISSSNTGESRVKIGSGIAEDTLLLFDGEDTSGKDYYVGLDDSDDAFKIGLGSAVGTTPYITVLSDGKVGIGDTTPAALLSVGATSQFQVNSSGAIAAAAGITSSGTITFSGLTTDGAVTVAGGVLSSEAQLAVARGGTGSSSFTSGSIIFSNGTILSQDNSNFFWDDTNNRLGIGTAAPTAQTHITSDINIALTGTVSVGADNSFVMGSGTLFNTELSAGDPIKIAGESFTVSAIYADDQLSLSSNHSAGASGVTAYTSSDLFRIDTALGANKVFVGSNGYVGINTATPIAALDADGAIVFNKSGTAADFVFGSPQLDHDTNTDHDRRMWFDKSKGAFRAGSATGSEWDDGNVGSYSFASGYNTTADGDYSTAMGYDTTASGNYSTAMGFFTTAGGDSSTAMGYNTTAGGAYSTAMGLSTTASVQSSTAMGQSTTASGLYSTAMGRSITAQGESSFGIGLDNTARTITQANTMAIMGGNVGIGDSSPFALLTVGDGDLFQVNSSGAIAAAAGITSSGTITFSGLSTNGVVSVAGGILASAATLTHEMGGLEADVSAYTGLLGINAGATSEVDTESELETHLGGLDVVTITADDITSANLITALSDETGTGLAVFATSPTFTTSLYSPLIIGGTGTTSDLSFQTTSGVGASGADMHFLVGNNGGTEAMTILNNGDIGIGVNDPDELLEIYGGNLKLSYDGSNFSTLATNASGELVVSASATGGSSMVIGDGSVENTSIIFDGNAQDYYAGLDDTDDAFKIGLGSVVGTTPYITVLSDGKVGIGTTSPSAKLDIDYDESTTTVGSYYGLRLDTDSTGVFATAASTTNIYGLYADAAATGVSTDGTVNTYGGYFTAAGENTGAAATNAYGLYVNGATGADNNYSAVFMNGNVGIGTASPTAALDADGSIVLNKSGTSTADFVFGSPQLDHDTNTDHDRRMWFDKSKGAFRAGSATGSEWDDGNVGSYSFASGYNTTADGDYSTAMGGTTTASGDYSTAMGQGTTASGYSSTAMGYYTTASGTSSTAMGQSTTASGNYSTAMGLGSAASGYSSTAMGHYTTASGIFSTAMGREIEASGDYSIAIALNDQNGAVVSQANTMAIMGGSVGIGTTSPSAKLDIDYDESTTTVGSYYGLRLDTDSTGVFATAASTTNIYGLYADAAATGVSTDGAVNTYGGYFTAAGENTGAATTNAYGLYVNGATGADNNYSAAFMNGNVGIGTASPSSLLDVYKTGTLSTDDIVNKISVDDAAASDEYFLTMISDADGTSDTEFKFTTDGTAYADGSWTGSGADYAEYFYTQDTDLQPGEAVCVDVTKDNAVKRCRNSGDNNIMGIVSEKPSVVGNGGEGKENNPNYKIIGMLGQVTGKVTNENEEIKIGDSLTSSSQPGVMRKSNPGESTVGVALENFSDKEGTIRILISRKNKSLTVEKVEETVAKNIAEMNVQDQVDNLVAEAKKKLDDQILSQKATLDDIQKYINIISGGNLDPADPITLASLRDQINDKGFAVKELQVQMDEIETRYGSYDQDIIDALYAFFLAVDGPQFMKFVGMADNINATGLLNGKLKIEEVETDGVKTAQITIINKDEDAPTIGAAVITPVEIDEDEDGIDDKTGSNGKSVEVNTKAVSETCKIFTSFENNPGSSSWVEKTFDEEDNYTGFKIMLSEPVSEEVKVNWWIIESAE